MNHESRINQLLFDNETINNIIIVITNNNNILTTTAATTETEIVPSELERTNNSLKTRP